MVVESWFYSWLRNWLYLSWCLFQISNKIPNRRLDNVLHTSNLDLNSSSSFEEGSSITSGTGFGLGFPLFIIKSCCTCISSSSSVCSLSMILAISLSISISLFSKSSTHLSLGNSGMNLLWCTLNPSVNVELMDSRSFS